VNLEVPVVPEKASNLQEAPESNKPSTNRLSLWLVPASDKNNDATLEKNNGISIDSEQPTTLPVTTTPAKTTSRKKTTSKRPTASILCPNRRFPVASEVARLRNSWNKLVFKKPHYFSEKTKHVVVIELTMAVTLAGSVILHSHRNVWSH